VQEYFESVCVWVYVLYCVCVFVCVCVCVCVVKRHKDQRQGPQRMMTYQVIQLTYWVLLGMMCVCVCVIVCVCDVRLYLHVCCVCLSLLLVSEERMVYLSRVLPVFSPYHCQQERHYVGRNDVMSL